jgi:hypothetical protein
MAAVAAHHPATLAEIWAERTQIRQLLPFTKRPAQQN